MRKTLLLLLLILLARMALSEEDQEVSASNQSAGEAVVREFFEAITAKDEVGVRKVIMPVLYMEILWLGDEPKNQTDKEQVEKMKKDFSALKCREVKVGDVVDFPGGRKVTVTAEMMNEMTIARAKTVVPVVAGKDLPTPLTVYLIDGKWRIDASPIIGARMVVKRMREQPKSETNK